MPPLSPLYHHNCCQHHRKHHEQRNDRRTIPRLRRATPLECEEERCDTAEAEGTAEVVNVEPFLAGGHGGVLATHSGLGLDDEEYDGHRNASELAINQRGVNTVREVVWESLTGILMKKHQRHVRRSSGMEINPWREKYDHNSRTSESATCAQRLDCTSFIDELPTHR